jgi:hypothetical protein
MRLLLRYMFQGGLLFVSACGLACAQFNGGLSVVPGNSPLGCLTHKEGVQLPAYPEREALLKEGATVRIRLAFEQPDAAPRVDVFFNSGSDVFADLVKAHAKRYRLPCLIANGEPLLATQEFQFVPGDGRKVISGSIRDEARASEFIRCVSGAESRPNYPRPTYGRPPEGTVIVQLTFVGATSVPKVDVLFDGGSKSLTSAVLAHVAGYRMPCLTAAEAPLKTRQKFSFRLEGASAYVLKDLSLKAFVGGLAELEKQSIRFDFSTMGCPFDVRFELLQPYAPNGVGELERADPNRREFLEWLKTVSLRLPRDAVPKVIGQTTTIAVPCGVLDLS